MDFRHAPVLLAETIEILNPRKGETFVDCTLGGGGHSEAILRQIGPEGRLIGIDQDEKALAAAGERLREFPNKTLVRANFSELKEVLEDLEMQQVDGIVFDLGVSSPQLDEAERGFSYQHDAPLDMRMDRRQETSAAELVNNLSSGELAQIIREYGEENWAKRIAGFIIEARTKKPVTTTGELVDIIKAAIPAGARREGPHPAKRTFQALRIAVNDELNRFRQALADAVEVLAAGGRVGVISFHSLEDRIAKETFQQLARTCTCPKELPVCQCSGRAVVKILTKKPVVSTGLELEQNPRARSAKLRAAQKL